VRTLATVAGLPRRRHLQSQSFSPFTVYVADGREYRVSTPDHAHVYPSGRRVSNFSDDDREIILPSLIVSGLALDGVSNESEAEPETE
jgi:hypothetical protein